MKTLFLILCYVFFGLGALCVVLDVIYGDATSIWHGLMWNFIFLSSLSGALKIRYNIKENNND